MAQILWGSQFKRGSAQSLIADENYNTYADLTTYLSSPLCYAGQVVTVKADTDSKKNGVYWISGTAGAYQAVKLSTSQDVADSTNSVFQWKGNVTSATLVKSGTGVKPGYAYRWNETATAEASNTLPVANSASGKAEILERGDMLVCSEVSDNVPKYSVIQNNIDLKDLEEQLSSLNDSIGAVSNRVTAAEGKITTLQGDMTTAKGDISTLKTQMTTAEGKVTTLESGLGDLSDAHDALVTQHGTLETKVTDIDTKKIPILETAITQHGTAITSLEGKFDAAGSANSAVKLKQARKIDGVSFDGKGDVSHLSTCSTSADVPEKTAKHSNFILDTGSFVYVRFTETNTASNPTINVNNTGAKAIHYQGKAIKPGEIKGKTIYGLIYDGASYNVVGEIGEEIPTVYYTDFATGETTESRTENSSITLDVLIPAVGTASNMVLQDIKSHDATKVAEIEWVSHSGGVHTYDCALLLGDQKRVFIATANTQEVVDLTVVDGKHYGYIMNGKQGAFGCALLCFDGSSLRVLKMEGATDGIMNALMTAGGADHDMFAFLPVGTKFISADGLTEYTKVNDTTATKELFVL